MTDIQTPEKVLKQYFGYDQFRPLQAEIIQSILEGNDALVLMPTGGGKSVCYQVPALVKPGMAIVVSPLIALMKDQVEALLANGVPAAYINSSQSNQQQSEIEAACTRGEIKLLYVSPEKLLSSAFQRWLQDLYINLFAIDEAHCISAWGHDFRPEYTQMKTLKQSFPHIPLVALTATADKLIRRDILEQLQLQEAEVFVSSFDRKNLSLTVRPGRSRLNQILDFLDTHPGQPGIIYCLSRNSTEELADKLYKSGYKASCYHAGLPAADRAATQEAFLKDDIQIICATIAFGMGIDKSNIRWVMHYNLPKNLESFYQEIGRAGRDGLPAETILFYSFGDLINWREMFAKGSQERMDLQIARLERMQQYAEAQICRRRVLLNYFSEESTSDCGNCDVCLQPRSRFDGTVLAQKALSATIRLQESVNMGLLIDVLRGSRSQTVLEKGYDQIKTYGAGADLKTDEWREYLTQMVNMGVLDVAYHQKYALHRGVLAEKVLKEGHQVWLVKPQVKAATQEKLVVSRKSQKEVLQDSLFDRLKAERKRLADANNVPPYIVFNDNTLLEMAKERPGTPQEMLQVTGVGEHKLQLYGETFLRVIREFVLEQRGEGVKMKGSTYLQTYEALQQGQTLEEIAQQRNLHIITIQSHVVALLERGYAIDYSSYVQPSEIQTIQNAIRQTGEQSAKGLFEHFGEKYDYFKIKLSMALYKLSGQS